MQPFLALHVGAGYHCHTNRPAYKALLESLCNDGIKSLRVGQPAIDVLERILQRMEDHELTNCGITGANMTICGTVEADACIVGESQIASIGAVPLASLHTDLDSSVHRYPISIARALWEKQLEVGVAGLQIPVFLTGTDAHEFAKESGLKTIPALEASKLISEDQIARYHSHLQILSKAIQKSEEEDALSDTVGAIIVDINGEMLAGASSGGISLKRRGRLGPAALPYMGVVSESKGNKSVGICLSGTGEQIIKTQIGQKLTNLFLDTPLPLETLRSVVANKFTQAECLKNDSSKSLGAIIVTKEHDTVHLTMLHTTPSFCVASIGGDTDQAKFCISRLKKGQSISIKSIGINCNQ